MSIGAQLQDPTSSIKTAEDLAAFREHLDQIISGDAFKGSRRSAQFLAFVVEKALAAHSEALKERTIGVELFGRPATYDTGEDAIVRVTATDVRRRLLQHYSLSGKDSEFRISLPTGGYIPEIEKTRKAASPAKLESAVEDQNSRPGTAGPQVVDTPLVGHPVQAVKTKPVSTEKVDRRVWWKVFFAFVAGVLVTSVSYYAATHIHRQLISPWNVILTPSRITRVIASDPDIAQVQELAHRQIPVSDYANGKYGCEWISLQNSTPCNDVFRGDKFAAVDASIIDKLNKLAQKVGAGVSVQSARSIRLPYLITDDADILLGSPHSNPWVDLYSDQMDFVIAYDQNRDTEIVINKHPRQGEQHEYVPTAKGGGTGESFSTLSLLHNPDQTGKVLLFAGITAEGTQAAGDFAMNFSELQSTLKKCGIDSNSTTSRYQILLRVQTMANTFTQTSVLACHSLR